MATINGRCDVIAILIADDRVNLADNDHQIIKYAFQTGDVQLVHLISKWYYTHGHSIDGIKNIANSVNNKINLVELQNYLEHD